MSRLVDSFGRQHTYLRISVTDRCNLRCVYCMPPEGVPWRSKGQILSYEEINRLARVFTGMGITKIRLTGGEPLVRPDIAVLFEMLGELENLDTLAITTNGVLLGRNVEQIARSRIKAINISLDSLQKERFQAITLRDDFDSVLSGLDKALETVPVVKLNVVVMAGRNDDEIGDFVELTRQKPLNVRFIEFMPFPNNKWCASGMLACADIKKAVERRYEIVPLEKPEAGVAKDFTVTGHRGTVSFITPVTDSFCSSCNRLRLTADGSLKTCLLHAPEVSLRDVLRSGADDDFLKELILKTVLQKPRAHPSVDELCRAANRTMVEIGG
jgi:GTP 3',8-cyclase